MTERTFTAFEGTHRPAVTTNKLMSKDKRYIGKTYSQLDEPATALEPETVLEGRYRLIDKIGSGGMGVVWSAEDKIAGRKVALKFVPNEVKNFETAVAQLKTSFNKIHELQHQHICSVYTLEEDASLGYYLVMRWLDGETLDKYIELTVGEHQPLPVEEMLRVLRPVAEALDYAHSRRIIHRDIKPSNIFLELDEAKAIRDVQVIDFGLASEIRSAMTKMTHKQYDNAGTRPYMAPEQWRSRPQSAATDQYALAVVVYELLAGHLPFENDDLELLRLSVLQDPPVPIREVSEQINAALLTALEKDSGERFGSCVEFIAALGGEAITVTKKPLSTRRTIAPPGVEPLMERGHLFLEDSEWDKAIEYFNRVLDTAPKYALAYTGLLCAELKIQSEELLGEQEKPISEQKHFRNAFRFADEDYRATIQGYDEAIRERIRQEQYDRLVQVKSKASKEQEYQGLAAQFRAMDGYKDTTELASVCEKQYHELKEQRELQERIEQERQEKECKQQEQYDRLVLAKNRVANEYNANEDYHEETRMVDLDARPPFDYLAIENKYQELAAQFREMAGYKNATEFANECNKKYDGLKKRRETQEQGVQKWREEQERKKHERERKQQEQDRKKQEQYDQLVQEYAAVSTENEYQELSKKFRAMDRYRNTVELANECYSKYDELKGLRLEAKRKQEEEEAAKKTKFCDAVAKGDIPTVKSFLESGMVINEKTNDGKPLLHVASEEEQEEMFEFLVKSGADVNAGDGDGNTLLHYAANADNRLFAEHLLKLGANIDVIDKDGDTPLHWAAMKGNAGMYQFLKEAGADIDATNTGGEKPRELWNESQKEKQLGHKIMKYPTVFGIVLGSIVGGFLCMSIFYDPLDYAIFFITGAILGAALGGGLGAMIKTMKKKEDLGCGNGCVWIWLLFILIKFLAIIAHRQ